MAVATKTIDAPPAHDSRVGTLWRSAIGRKALMAITGLVLFAYVLVHMIGNLQAFEGATALDRYAERLRLFPAALWAIRAILLVAFLVHVVAGADLWAGRGRTRAVGYRDWRPVASTPASRTMIWSGFLVLGFVVYHLLDLTVGVWNPDFHRGEVFHNLVASLARGAAAAFYVLAVAGLGVHLWHGLWSATQSLGVASRVFTPGIRRLAAALGTIIAVGFAAIPLAVVLGLVR